MHAVHRKHNTTKKGEDSSEKAGQFFREGLKDLFPNLKQDLVDLTWSSIRCGLFHNGMTGNGIFLNTDEGNQLEIALFKINNEDKVLINPIEVEPISEEELNERIRGDIETSLFLDGYSNEEIVVINLTNNTFKEDIKQCIGNKSHVAVINLDISNKLNGIISGAVSNEYGWSLDGVYTTLNRIYNHMADPENSANLGIVMIQVYKIPEPTLDQFGNSITHDKVQLGTFILCSTIEEQINWEGMDWKRIEPLLLIDWKGAEKKTSLEKFADSLESLLLYS